MNRVCLPIVKSLCIAFLAIVSVAHASEEKKVVKADAAKGEALYNTGDVTRNITACIACHGAAGNSSIAENPKLSGQHGAYIHKQLVSFKTGERKNAIMAPIAKGMTEEDMQNLIAYLAKSKPTPGAAKNKDTVELGKKIFRGGIAEKNVPACAACHSANGAGMPAQFPRLAGQHQAYTTAQLMSFRADTRKNEQMSKIVKRMSDEEIQAVSDYVAGLK
ncbi:MAG: c-type cytochrome [Herminiimonas sp.]|uniref:c-type cytochrome n=1 Tax=Herminiimonas sp. TaxID=1926289 RepID=UPI002716FF25|nr:c-type cytochrome [Herminiimonas sp.]MDO9421618.1 c-type cytochrome [Herminiimonas sp.]MDO9422027.1 c-type cytochrome [Herminiimonas sp.]